MRERRSVDPPAGAPSGAQPQQRRRPRRRAPSRREPVMRWRRGTCKSGVRGWWERETCGGGGGDERSAHLLELFGARYQRRLQRRLFCQRLQPQRKCLLHVGRRSANGGIVVVSVRSSGGGLVGSGSGRGVGGGGGSGSCSGSGGGGVVFCPRQIPRFLTLLHSTRHARFPSGYKPLARRARLVAAALRRLAAAACRRAVSARSAHFWWVVGGGGKRRDGYSAG